MKQNDFTNTNVLQEIFELPNEWTKALYSIEYCLTKHSISKEKNEEKKNEKMKWLQQWEEGIVNHYAKSLIDNNFSLVCDDVALQEYLRRINSNSEQKAHAYLVIIEALFFRPYYPLESKNITEKESVKRRLSYNIDIDYLSSLSKELNIDKRLLKSFQNRFNRAFIEVSGKLVSILVFAISAGVAIAITGGLLAPQIAILFATAGLSGAAAISSGLAALGGGAIAAGGAGMAGGITVLVATGGILGVVGGGGIGVLVANSPELACIIAAKLEVYFSEVLLPILKDPETARNILRGQEKFIRLLNDQLEKSHNISDAEKKAFKTLQKAIKILQLGLGRNRKTLLKYIT